MTTADLIQVDEQALAKKSGGAVESAKSTIVRDQETYDKAGLFLKALKALQAEIREELDPTIKKLHEAHRSATGLRKKYLAPLEDAEEILKGKMGSWLQEQERIKREAERKREAEIQKQLDAQKQVSLLDCLINGSTEPSPDEQAAAELAIILQAPAVPDLPKTEGVQARKSWKHRVVDPLKVPREYLIVDEGKLRKLATDLKDKAAVPGVEFYEETTIAAGKL